jgi:hypothetical protein
MGAIILGVVPNAYVVLLVASPVYGTVLMVAGGALILVGVHLAVRAGRRTPPRNGIDRRDGLESSP